MEKATKIYGVWKTDSAMVGECSDMRGDEGRK